MEALKKMRRVSSRIVHLFLCQLNKHFFFFECFLCAKFVALWNVDFILFVAGRLICMMNLMSCDIVWC